MELYLNDQAGKGKVIRTELCKNLKAGKLISIETINGNWLMFYQNTFPYIYEKKGLVELLHRHSGNSKYHSQHVSEWCTPSGILSLLNYIIKHDFDYLEPERKNRKINAMPVDLADVAEWLSYDDFIEKILSFHERNIEMEMEGDDERLKNYLSRIFLQNRFVLEDKILAGKIRSILESEQEGRLTD